MKNDFLTNKARLFYIIAGLICCLLAIVLMVSLMGSPKPTSETESKTDVDTIAVEVEDVSDPLLGENGTLGFVHGYGNEGMLIAIPSEYTSKDELIHQNVLSPLLEMIDEAKRDGVNLTVVSAYRSYDRQKHIWETKWGDSDDVDVVRAEGILRYSSFPGTSRHHWGTDVDFNSVSLTYWQGAEGRKVFAWLQNNASRFGFCQVYGKGRKSGYEVEAWHWSYMPTAQEYYDRLSQSSVLEIALNQEVKGAMAVRQLAPKMMNYITDINTCQVDSVAP